MPHSIGRVANIISKCLNESNIFHRILVNARYKVKHVDVESTGDIFDAEIQVFIKLPNDVSPVTIKEPPTLPIYIHPQRATSLTSLD